MAHHCREFSIGDKVIINFTHGKLWDRDLGFLGVIREVRPSFCKIEEGRYKMNKEKWLYNHTYGQFKKIDDQSDFKEFQVLDRFEPVFKGTLKECEDYLFQHDFNTCRIQPIQTVVLEDLKGTLS